MRAKSLIWAPRAIPSLLMGLFALASVTATAEAQPRRGQPRGPGVRGGGAAMARTVRLRKPNRMGAMRGGRPGARGRVARRGRRGQPRAIRPGMGRRARPELRPGRRGGRGRRGGMVGRPANFARKVVPTAKAKPAPNAVKASQTEAQRLNKLKAANKDKRIVGAVSRKLKTKGGFVNQLLFYILFSLIICFCLVTITRKSPLMAALSLLVVFLGLAGVYLFLQAPFMAAIQLIVYAGAVIVLFVFVIMSIGFDEERSVEDLGKEILYFAMAFMLTGAGAFVFHAGSGWTYVAGFAAMELMALAFIIMGKLQYPVTRFLGIASVTFALAQVVRLVQLSPVLIGKTVGLKTQLDAPKQLYAASPDAGFGNAKAIGQSVFTENVFAFEALSLLLLASIVAAVVIVRSRSETKEQTS